MAATGDAKGSDFSKLLTSDYCGDITTNARKNFLIGWMLTNFSEKQADWKLAKSYFEKAAALGYPQAYANLFRMYQNGVGVEQDSEQAEHYLQTAADKGYGRAWTDLGFIREHRASNMDDIKEAEACYLKALKCGYLIAGCNLAHLYIFSDHFETAIYLPQALIYLKDAERTGHAGTLYILGRIYESGIGIAPDLDTAKQYYRQAAKQGHHLSFQALARLSESVEEEKELIQKYTQRDAQRKTPIGNYRLYQSHIEIGGYEFRNTRYFLRAIATNEAFRQHGISIAHFADMNDEDTLEWKGDAILNSVVKTELSTLDSSSKRSELDRWSQQLVCNADERHSHGGPLYRVGKSIRLQPLLLLEPKRLRIYRRRGKHKKKHTVEMQLANIVERLIGAIVEDGGRLAAENFIKKLWTRLGLNRAREAESDFGESDSENMDGRIQPKTAQVFAAAGAGGPGPTTADLSARR